jgi:hypothetical protein
MATKRRRTHHKAKFTIPLAIVAGFAGGPVASTIAYKNRSGDWGKALMWEGGSLVGYDTENSRYAGYSQMVKAGIYPLAIGFAGHFIAQKFGINKMIARAGIPFIRI